MKTPRCKICGLPTDHPKWPTDSPRELQAHPEDGTRCCPVCFIRPIPKSGPQLPHPVESAQEFFERAERRMAEAREPQAFFDADGAVRMPFTGVANPDADFHAGIAETANDAPDPEQVARDARTLEAHRGHF